MDKILAWFSPTRWAILGLVVLAVGLCGWWVADSIGDAREATVSARYERKIQAAVNEAIRQAGLLQKGVDDANQNYQKAMADISDRDKRIGALLERMRNSGPSPGAVARASSATLGKYAAEVSGDFADCRDKYRDMGKQAARASEAAWAHRLSWPAWDEAAKDFDNKLKGMK